MVNRIRGILAMTALAATCACTSHQSNAPKYERKVSDTELTRIADRMRARKVIHGDHRGARMQSMIGHHDLARLKAQHAAMRP